MKKIAFLDTVHPVLEEGLSELGWLCEDLTDLSNSAIHHRIKDYHGIVIRSRLPMDAAFLDQAIQLEFIARSGAGMENIDEAYCERRGIQLFNAPEGNRNAVAEHALGMLLSLFNKLSIGNQEVRNGEWNRELNRGVELDGKTVGIIGYGNNGSAFARKLRGFDVKVLAYDKYKKGYGDEFVTASRLEDLFAACDVISFHIPQNEETLYMADEAFFDCFSKPVYVINLARGKIIKTSAMVKQLKNGRVLGACLDVLEYEKSSFENMFSSEERIPEAFQYLLSSNKVLLTPHVGGWTQESYFKLSDVLLQKIIKYYNL